MNLYIVRHGETDWNKLGKTMGRTDIPLNELGIKQANIARDKLKDINFDFVFSSPLRRTLETAKIIRGENIIIDERLIERDNGILEGKTKEERKEILDKYDNDYIGAESFLSMQKRVESFLNDLKVKYNCNNVLIVTHGGLGVNIRCFFDGEPINQDYRSYLLDNCEIIKYEM